MLRINSQSEVLLRWSRGEISCDEHVPEAVLRLYAEKVSSNRTAYNYGSNVHAITAIW